jgi:uncharacterized protein (DUF2235 family)
MNRSLSLLVGALMVSASSCSHNVQQVPNLARSRDLSELDLNKPKRIQIFFDGTANNWLARTNVRRRFELSGASEDPAHPCFYVEGVGVNTLSGKLFGTGIKKRVLEAYCFLAQHWSGRDNDDIQIYGFSRGAFQARVLAGMMAHCGLPDKVRSGLTQAELEKLVDRLWDYCREDLRDLPKGDHSASEWRTHLANNRRMTEEKFGGKFNNPPIQMLAIWDTVPALPFTEMDELGRSKDGEAQRYKVRPYPNIKNVFHALALDEKRNRYAPLLVGPPLDSATKVHEVWFPGAHSDVGGGYRDSNDLAGSSLVWLHRLMVARSLTNRPQGFYEDSHGLLHHPEKMAVMKLVNKEVRRLLPEGSMVDFSVFRRADGKPHPEEGVEGGVVYEPVLETIGSVQADASAETVATRELKLSGPYTKASAAAALRKIGLRLYEPENTGTQSTGVTPLDLSEMKVLLKVVDTPPNP